MLCTLLTTIEGCCELVKADIVNVLAYGLVKADIVNVLAYGQQI